MKKLCFLLAFCLPIAASGQPAAMPHEGIRQAALEFVRAQTANLPGKVEIKVGPMDTRLVLAQCNTLEAYLPAGSPLLGNTSIGVRCKAAKGWSVFIPTRIRVTVATLISARQLRQGETLKESDFTLQENELSQAGYLTDPGSAIGKIIKYSVAAGQPLKAEMLRAPFLARSGQAVLVRVQGNGFKVETEAVALGNAAEGESVQVRSPAGKVLSGQVQPDGSVGVAP